MKKACENLKFAGLFAFALTLFGSCVYSVALGVRDAWIYRNEPVYLISETHNPIYKQIGFIPVAAVCYSPAHCEPNGKPSLRYLRPLGEHEVVAWGLDPRHEGPPLTYKQLHDPRAFD